MILRQQLAIFFDFWRTCPLLVAALCCLSFLSLMLFSVEGFAHDLSLHDKQVLVDAGRTSFVFLGAKHMVTGLDHILFLLGLVFFLSSLRDIVKVITLFTIGHSLTLVFATLYEVQINYYLIDALVGLSVLYKGAENLGVFSRLSAATSFRLQPNLFFMVFLFGLIHGLGLSSRLQELHHLPDFSINSILLFNVGVELGQIVALFPIVILLRQLRNASAYDGIKTWVNSGLVVAGLFFMIHYLWRYSMA